MATPAPLHVRYPRYILRHRRVTGLLPMMFAAPGAGIALPGGSSTTQNVQNVQNIQQGGGDDPFNVWDTQTPQGSPLAQAFIAALTVYGFRAQYGGTLPFLRSSTGAADLRDRTFAIGNRSTQIAAYRPQRRYLFVLNIGTANPVSVSFGQTARSGAGVVLPSNGFYEPTVPPASEVNAISTAGTTVVIVEG